MKRMTRTARRGVTVGLAITSVALLTACGTTSGGTAGGDDEAMTELGEGEGQVSLLAWPGYVEDGTNDPAVDWVTPFEEETGCEVTSKTYGTSGEAVNRAVVVSFLLIFVVNFVLTAIYFALVPAKFA